MEPAVPTSAHAATQVLRPSPSVVRPSPPDDLVHHFRATVDDLVRQFWAAPAEAVFRQRTVAAALCKSESWCERKRWEGGGPRYIKAGRSVIYRKSAVLEWLESQQQVSSTSEVEEAA